MLRKNRESRLQHVGDVRLELVELDAAGELAAPRETRRLPRALLAVGAALLAAAAFLLGRALSSREPPRWQRLTYQLGWIRDGRFAPDGQSVVYAAAWNGGPLRVYRKHPESPESIALDLPSASVLAVSSSGELALALDCRATHSGVCAGTLARAPLTGGSPRALAEAVQQADWMADGGLLVARDAAGGSRLELPSGKVLYQTAGHVSCPRVSPEGGLVAFLDHPYPRDDRGRVSVVDLSGRTRALTKEWDSVFGVAWSPSGREVWFTASESGARRELYAVSLSGRLRAVFRAPSSLSLLDVARSGRVLLGCEDLRLGARGAGPGEKGERELSWLDRSLVTGLSRDGRLLLLTEQSEGTGADLAACVRRMDGSGVTRLGSGWAVAVSPDSQWVLTKPAVGGSFVVVPVGPGATRPLRRAGVDPDWGSWLPDGRRLLVSANEGRGRSRLYLIDVETGTWRPFADDAVSRGPVSPDGKVLAGRDARGSLVLQPLEGGAAVPVRGAAAGDSALAFCDGGRTLLVMTPRRVPRDVYRIDLASGARAYWRSFVPEDATGVSVVQAPFFSADATAYAYSYYRSLGVIYAVDGLR
jgi:eukaryotic-like serine/threonine-protein kinase